MITKICLKYEPHFKGALKDNLRTGETALKKFKTEFPYLKSNTLWRQRSENIIRKNGFMPSGIAEIVDKYMFTIAKARDQFSEKEPFEARIKMIKKILHKTNMGNCGECAELLRAELLKTNPEVEVISFNFPYEFKDHSFCVIGLDKNADISNPATWGKGAVVIDGWKNFVLSVPDAMVEYENLYKGDYKDFRSDFIFSKIDYTA